MRLSLSFFAKEKENWWVPNPPFANPGVAEKAPCQSLQGGVAGVYSLLEIPTDSYHFPSHLTPSSDPNSHFARKALFSYPRVSAQGVRHLVAFHPRPQIASDLGRNVTRSFNPHRNRNQFPSGSEILAFGRRFKSQPASTRCDLRIASPTRPLFTDDLNSSHRKPAGRNHRIRAAFAAANRRIAGHKATKVRHSSGKEDQGSFRLSTQRKD